MQHGKGAYDSGGSSDDSGMGHQPRCHPLHRHRPRCQPTALPATDSAAIRRAATHRATNRSRCHRAATDHAALCRH